MDAVELNSLKEDFTIEQLIDYYAEGFIDLGYISLFAAAFPLGPVIALISQIIEVKSKIWVFLYVYKRPFASKCIGIGEWFYIWEIISFLSVFTNFALLYFHHTDIFYFTS